MFLIEYIKKYKITYMSVVLTFLIGITIGIFATFKTPQNDKTEINDYLNITIKSISNGSVDRKYIFKEKLIDNIKFLSIVWLLGCTVIASFTIYILMIYKGLIFGYITTSVISILGIKLGLRFLLSTIIIKNILFLPIVFLLATSGIRMYRGIIKREGYIRRELVRHTIVMIISLLFTTIISFIDTFISLILLNFL